MKYRWTMVSLKILVILLMSLLAVDANPPPTLPAGFNSKFNTPFYNRGTFSQSSLASSSLGSLGSSETTSASAAPGQTSTFMAGRPVYSNANSAAFNGIDGPPARGASSQNPYTYFSGQRVTNVAYTFPSTSPIGFQGSSSGSISRGSRADSMTGINSMSPAGMLLPGRFCVTDDQCDSGKVCSRLGVCVSGTIDIVGCCTEIKASCVACHYGMSEQEWCQLPLNKVHAICEPVLSEPQCCQHKHAECMACAAKVSTRQWCGMNAHKRPDVPGCERYALPRACCVANTATCLACEEGVTIERFCSRPHNRRFSECSSAAQQDECCGVGNTEAECKACWEGLSLETFCSAHSEVEGCEKGNGLYTFTFEHCNSFTGMGCFHCVSLAGCSWSLRVGQCVHDDHATCAAEEKICASSSLHCPLSGTTAALGGSEGATHCDNYSGMGCKACTELIDCYWDASLGRCHEKKLQDGCFNNPKCINFPDMCDNEEDEKEEMAEDEQCGVNERWTECGSSTCFESDCSHPPNYTPFCTPDCKRGCQCLPGYARQRSSLGSICVHASACAVPGGCGPDERYTTCASSSCFEDTCAEPDPPADRACTLDCRAGCQCVPGFVRRGQDCVPKRECETDKTVVEVRATNFSFVPSSVTIREGQTVRWSGLGGGHNVVEVDRRNMQPLTGGFRSGSSSNNADTFEVVFPRSGTYSYICEPHVGRGMRAIVNVLPATPSPTPLAPVDPFTMPDWNVSPYNPISLSCLQRQERERIQCGGFSSLECHIVQCQADGNYEPKQCVPNTFTCWCLDVWGVVRVGSWFQNNPTLVCPQHDF